MWSNSGSVIEKRTEEAQTQTVTNELLVFPDELTDEILEQLRRGEIADVIDFQQCGSEWKGTATVGTQTTASEVCGPQLWYILDQFCDELIHQSES